MYKKERWWNKSPRTQCTKKAYRKLKQRDNTAEARLL